MNSKKWDGFFNALSSERKRYYRRRRACKKCDSPITDFNKRGMCRKCWLVSREGHKHTQGYAYNKGRTCKVCDKPITNYNKSGLCPIHKPSKKTGSSYLTAQGYRFILVDGKFIPEHRYVWEQANGQPLPKGWVVHHLNGLKSDNRPANLKGLPRRKHSSGLVLKTYQGRIKELELIIASCDQCRDKVLPPPAYATIEKAKGRVLEETMKQSIKLIGKEVEPINGGGNPMTCLNCGGSYISTHGDLRLFDKSIGFYRVRDVDYSHCNKCGRKLYTSTTCTAIEQARDSVLEDAIRHEAVSNFITSTEVCMILDITRQALSKHRRIRRGFIYTIELGGIKLYHRKSVEQFKDSGDGRFRLHADAIKAPPLDLTNPEDNAKYIQEIEEAHKMAGKSKLRFRGKAK